MLNGVYGGLNEKAPQVSLIWMLGSQLAVWEDEEELVETAFGISRLGPRPVCSLSFLLVVQDVNSELLLYLICFVCCRLPFPLSYYVEKTLI